MNVSYVVNCFQKFSIFAVWNSQYGGGVGGSMLWIAFKSLVSLQSETVQEVEGHGNRELWIAFKSLVSLQSETVTKGISMIEQSCELLSKV